MTDHSMAIEVLRGHKIDPSDRQQVNRVAEAVLSLPQAPAPVEHYFGPGVYIRQVSFTAGTFAVGHYQRNEHLNFFIKGRVAMVKDGGEIEELVAPIIFVGQPGQKIGYIIEDVVWQNIYANPDNETDIETLEERHLDREGPYAAHEQKLIDEGMSFIDKARSDYEEFLTALGITDDDVRAEMDRDTDIVGMSQRFSSRITIRKSQISGSGIFASVGFREGELIGPANIQGHKTAIGRYTNHSHQPNGEFIFADNGDIILVAKRDINGCLGGGHGDEITIDYRNAIDLRNRIGERGMIGE